MGATVTATDHLLLHFARNGGARDGATELLVLERGEGVFVVDSLGRRHLDGLSNLFCAQLGYSFGSEMAEVASRQLIELPFATNWGVAHPAAVELATRLAEIAPGSLDHVFFTSGGSESVEAAWKLVRQYHLANDEPQRTKAIARDRAYHGVTLGALALTGVPGFKEPFGPPAIETFHVSNTNDFRRPESGRELTSLLLDEVEAVIEREGAETIAMIIAEPVQNAGGCLQPPEGYWAGLREICDRHGILLVADEVITGFGRLGEWFGVSRFGAVPDLITTAKGLTSAYAPMGAVLASDRIAASALRLRPDAPARDHLRRTSAVGGDRAEEPRAVRARAGARQRPGARGLPGRPARVAPAAADRRRHPRERLLLGGRARPGRSREPFRCRAARRAPAQVPAGRADPGAADRPGRRPR